MSDPLADIDAQVLEVLRGCGHTVTTVDEAVAATRAVYGLDEHNARLLLYGDVDTIDVGA